MRVWRKGSGAAQWLPASPEAFVWIRLYLAEIGLLGPEEPIGGPCGGVVPGRAGGR